MKSRPTRRTMIVIVAVLLAVAATVAAAVRVTDSDRAAEHCAILPDTIGLYKGNPVTTMGYQIGTVTAIDPKPEGVRVAFTVGDGRSLPAGVRAVTRSKSVLADRSLELVAPADHDGRRLPAGQCISRDNSYTPASISEIAGSAADLMRELAPDADSTTIEGAIEQMARSVDGLGPDVARLMRTASAAATEPEQTIADIGTIVTTMAPLTAEALDKWSDLRSIVTKLPDAAQVAADTLWPGAQRMVAGLIPLIHTVADIQLRYGDELWPLVDMGVDLLHVATARLPEIQGALNSLPALTGLVTLAARPGSSPVLRLPSPFLTVEVADPAAVCAVVKKTTASRQNLCRVHGGSVSIRADALTAIGAGR